LKTLLEFSSTVLSAPSPYSLTGTIVCHIVLAKFSYTELFKVIRHSTLQVSVEGMRENYPVFSVQYCVHTHNEQI